MLDQVKMSYFLKVFTLSKKLMPKFCICKRYCNAGIFVFLFHWWFRGAFTYFRKVLNLELFNHQAGRPWHSDITAKFRTNLFLPVPIRTFIPTFRTWHVPNSPITSCLSLKCAAKHWVWNTSLQQSKHQPKGIQESPEGSGCRTKLTQIGQDSKWYLKSSTQKRLCLWKELDWHQ